MPNELLENWLEYQAQKEAFERSVRSRSRVSLETLMRCVNDCAPGWLDRAPRGVVFERDTFDGDAYAANHPEVVDSAAQSRAAEAFA